MSTILGDKITMVHEFGSATFNDPAMTDWPGLFKCHIDRLDGWQQTVDKNIVRSPRGVGDGDYIGNRWAAKSRMLEIEGYIHAPNRLALDQAFDDIINKAFPDDTDITLTRYEPIPKYVTCRLAGSIEPLQYFPEGMRWGGTLLCADPFKYNPTDDLIGSAGVAGLSSGGMTLPLTFPLAFNMSAQGEGNQIVVYNAGTARSYANIFVHGPLTTGWRVENATTGEISGFDLSLGSSDLLKIDNYNRIALLNDQPVSGLITGSWWALAPKSNTIRLYGNYDSSAGFSISGKSTWR